jgi:hypothetical protein
VLLTDSDLCARARRPFALPPGSCCYEPRRGVHPILLRLNDLPSLGCNRTYCFCRPPIQPERFPLRQFRLFRSRCLPGGGGNARAFTSAPPQDTQDKPSATLASVRPRWHYHHRYGQRPASDLRLQLRDSRSPERFPAAPSRSSTTGRMAWSRLPGRSLHSAAFGANPAGRYQHPQTFEGDISPEETFRLPDHAGIFTADGGRLGK